MQITTMPRCEIGADEAHVWLARPGDVREPEACRLAREVLSAPERERMRRMHFPHDRRLYLVAHSLVRYALSACVPAVPAAAWTFRAGSHGKPELPAPWDTLRFNLSHTHGLVAVVVTREVDCGVDVELAQQRGIDSLGPYVLAEPELAALADLPEEQRAMLFFRYWTLKEAYVKARGLGMSLPLDACVFDPQGATVEMVSHPVDEHPEPHSWQFVQEELPGDHILAVALRAGTDRPIRVVRHDAAPDWRSPGLLLAA